MYTYIERPKNGRRFEKLIKIKRKAMKMCGLLHSALAINECILTNFQNQLQSMSIDGTTILFYFFEVSSSGP